MTTTSRISRKVVFGLAGLGLLAAPAALAATSAQLTLTGTVQQILAITVTPTASASGLDLTGAITALKVATVVAEANNPAGYAISVSSLNQTGGDCGAANGPCFHSATATTNDDVSFSLLRNAVAVSFSGAGGSFVSTTARSIVGGDSYDAKITYDATAANLDQATDYSETLT
ncbi:MAG: hypothetical protein HQ495_14720, partial [Alphaproteobacteria bacterium]|nr:hypothetical protein [Alphaproteobacteria bacterium]